MTVFHRYNLDARAHSRRPTISMACLLQMYSTCIEIYKNPVLFWQRDGYGTIQTDDTVSTAYNLLFYQHAKDSCKDGTKDSQ